MAEQLATVAVVPHERFSLTHRSLESILTHTERPLELIYIDGGSPPPIRKYLERQAGEHRFRLFRTDHYLTPNSARNLALLHVHTRYVAFVDNDVIVSPGWLEALVDCAEATGAWVVGPIHCEREPVHTHIRMAGGAAGFFTENGRRVFREASHSFGKPLALVGPTLKRRPVEQVEFHCCLVRMEAIDRLGPLDEGLMSAAAHTDLCLATREIRQEVYLEPKSVVTYLAPPPFETSDLPYYQLRWSQAWNEATLAHFAHKWHIDINDQSLARMGLGLADHRRVALEPYRRLLRLLGSRPARLVERALLAPWEEASNRARYPSHLHIPPHAQRVTADRRAA